MSKGLLKKLVTKKKIKSFIGDLENQIQSSICIKDESSQAIFGNMPVSVFEHPVKYNEKIVGFVYGEKNLAALAQLLSLWLILEAEKTSLGKELLDRYREISFYFNITEQLAASHEPKEVARFLIEEAQRLIKAEDISIFLIEKTNMEWLGSTKSEGYSQEILRVCRLVADRAMLSAKAEIINELPEDLRNAQGNEVVHSLMCAPLAINNKILGVIMVSSGQSINYTAGDLKILSTVAYQAAAAIENAKLFAALKETIFDLQTKKEELITSSKVRMEFSHIFISVVLMFSVYTFLLAFMSNIHTGEQGLYIASRSLEIIFVLANVWLVFRSGLPLASFGLTLLNAQKAVKESLLISAGIMIALVFVKLILIKYLPAFQGASIITWKYVGWDYVTYIVVAPLQEFLTRGVLQGSIQRFLIGRLNWLWAAVLTSTLFGVFHIHESLELGIAAIVGGILWGAMYARHKTLIGVSLSHFLIGNWLGILGLWNMMIH